MATARKKPADLHKEDMDWLKKAKLLKRASYIEIEDGMITAVFCKRCGRKIQGMMPSNRPPVILKGRDGRLIEQRFVRLGALPGYTSVEIEGDDGSKHESPCCTECAPFLTPDELDAFLIADTEAEIFLEGKAGRKISDKLLENRVMRRLKRKEK